MKVTYITEDPFDGKSTIIYPYVEDFVQAHPMYKEFLSGNRAKTEHTIEINIPSYPLNIKVIVEDG